MSQKVGCWKDFEVVLESFLESLWGHAEYVKMEPPLKREPRVAGREGVLIGTFFLLFGMLFLKPLF